MVLGSSPVAVTSEEMSSAEVVVEVIPILILIPTVGQIAVVVVTLTVEETIKSC